MSHFSLHLDHIKSVYANSTLVFFERSLSLNCSVSRYVILGFTSSDHKTLTIMRCSVFCSDSMFSISYLLRKILVHMKTFTWLHPSAASQFFWCLFLVFFWTKFRTWLSVIPPLLYLTQTFYYVIFIVFSFDELVDKSTKRFDSFVILMRWQLRIAQATKQK